MTTSNKTEKQYHLELQEWYGGCELNGLSIHIQSQKTIAENLNLLVSSTELTRHDIFPQRWAYYTYKTNGLFDDTERNETGMNEHKHQDKHAGVERKTDYFMGSSVPREVYHH